MKFENPASQVPNAFLLLADAFHQDAEWLGQQVAPLVLSERADEVPLLVQRIQEVGALHSLAQRISKAYSDWQQGKLASLADLLHPVPTAPAPTDQKEQPDASLPFEFEEGKSAPFRELEEEEVLAISDFSDAPLTEEEKGRIAHSVVEEIQSHYPPGACTVVPVSDEDMILQMDDPFVMRDARANADILAKHLASQAPEAGIQIGEIERLVQSKPLTRMEAPLLPDSMPQPVPERIAPAVPEKREKRHTPRDLAAYTDPIISVLFHNPKIPIAEIVPKVMKLDPVKGNDMRKDKYLVQRIRNVLIKKGLLQDTKYWWHLTYKGIEYAKANNL